MTVMCRNLTDLNREGITALPIHDSVIVSAKYEGRAFEIMERNLALKSGPQRSEKSAHKSASQVLDKLPQKEPPDLIPNLIPDLHNDHSGAGRVVVEVSPPVPSWVVSLPSDLAALAVVAWLYADGEVAGRYSAPRSRTISASLTFSNASRRPFLSHQRSPPNDSAGPAAHDFSVARQPRLCRLPSQRRPSRLSGLRRRRPAA
jgi:hypothetical protein